MEELSLAAAKAASGQLMIVAYSSEPIFFLLAQVNIQASQLDCHISQASEQMKSELKGAF